MIRERTEEKERKELQNCSILFLI